MEGSKRKQIALLAGFCIAVTAVTSLGGLCMRLSERWLKILLLALCNLTNGALALLFLRLSGQRLIVSLRGGRQYAIALGLAAALGVGMILLPIPLGFSLFGHTDFVPWKLAYAVLNNLLIIGPVEELMFREYVQGTLCGLLPKRGWLGVVLASALFGAWHLINGSVMQALITAGIGCVFGFARHRLNGCTWLSVALGHGLYDTLCDLAMHFLF